MLTAQVASLVKDIEMADTLLSHGNSNGGINSSSGNVHAGNSKLLGLHWPCRHQTRRTRMITEDQRDKFIKDAATCYVSRGGVSEEDAMEFANAFDIDEWVGDGFSGTEAADEDMSNWGNDEGETTC